MTPTAATQILSGVDHPRVSTATPKNCPLAELRARLRRVGMRPTRQRLALGWLLFGGGDRHLSAEMLYEEAMGAKIPVSLATIYNTLHQFKNAGLIRQLVFDGTKAYFDTNPTEHHHFYLESENRIIDMPECELTIGAIPAAPDGMEIASVEILVRVRPRKGAVYRPGSRTEARPDV